MLDQPIVQAALDAVIQQEMERKVRGGWTPADFDKFFAESDEATWGGCQKCPRMLVSGKPDQYEIYVYTMDDGQVLFFDVHQARRIVDDRSRTLAHLFREELIEMGLPETVFNSHDNGRVTVCEEHLSHIPKTSVDRPGIIAVIPTPDGLRDILIDGTHRLTIKLRAGAAAASCHVLNLQESKACCFQGWPEDAA